MNTLRLSLVRSTAMTALVASFSLAGVACASYPAPNEHLASSMAAVRGAQEVGAAQVPRAALHLKLAEDQIAQAKKFMEDGDNERADYMTLRAYNDATLALTLAREEQMRAKTSQSEKTAQDTGKTVNPTP